LPYYSVRSTLSGILPGKISLKLMKRSPFRLILITYLAIVGVVSHIAGITTILIAPEKTRSTIAATINHFQRQLTVTPPSTTATPETYSHETYNNVLPPYKPGPKGKTPANTILINNQPFNSLINAVAALKDGNEMRIGPGIYHEAIILKADNITIIGEGSVVFENATIQEKGALVIQGNWTQIHNIECRHIKVRDKNGACIRHEGKNLLLDNVYFHDSEQGLLTGGAPGLISIQNSRFENLGANSGQAHGIYVGGGELVIHNSIFIRARNEGHEIKSRAKKTYISKSIVASLDAKDSRLLDIPNGGNLTVVNSVLVQGPYSANHDAIGYGLEGIKHTSNSVTLQDNVIILESQSGNRLIHHKEGTVTPDIRNNVIISQSSSSIDKWNSVFVSRAEAGLPPFPFLPTLKQ